MNVVLLISSRMARAMLALRNPRARELIRDDFEQALEYIGFLSFLAKLLDRAERT
jgi:hypothetical protein